MTLHQTQAKLAEIGQILEERFDTRPLDERSIGFDYAAGPVPLACDCELNPNMRAFLFRGIFDERGPGTSLSPQPARSRLPTECARPNEE